MTQAHTRHRLFIVVDKHITAWRVEEALRGLGYRPVMGMNPTQPVHDEVYESPNSANPDVVMLMTETVERESRLPTDCPMCRVLVVSGRTDRFQHLGSGKTRESTGTNWSGPMPYAELLDKIQQVA